MFQVTSEQVIMVDFLRRQQVLYPYGSLLVNTTSISLTRSVGHSIWLLKITLPPIIMVMKVLRLSPWSKFEASLKRLPVFLFQPWQNLQPSCLNPVQTVHWLTQFSRWPFWNLVCVCLSKNMIMLHTIGQQFWCKIKITIRQRISNASEVLQKVILHISCTCHP